MQLFSLAHLTRWHRPRWSALALPSLVLPLLLLGFAFSHISHAAGAVTWYVSPTGNDGNDCLSTLTACKTIGATITKAAAGDQIIAATGLYTEHLVLEKSLTIAGAGVDATILDGVRSGAVISITNTISSTTLVTITGVTIRNGQAGIINIGNLNLISSRVSNNPGSGIVNSFTMALNNVVVSNNAGGGLSNGTSGRLTLLDVTISHNTGGFGGGIYNTGAITLTNVTISGNSAIFGGGIYTEGPAPLTHAAMSPALTPSRTAPAAPVPSVRLTNVTISSNRASTSGGGIYNNPFAFVGLKNTIIASNTNGNCKGSGVVSAGNNLSSDGSCALTAPGDRMNTDPLLGPLQDNTGTTPTQALRPGSPAIDHGDPSRCPPTDQRGVVRPADGDGNGTAICDIGAYELRWLRLFLPWVATTR